MDRAKRLATFIKWLMTQYFVEGRYTELTIKIEDGLPVYVDDRHKHLKSAWEGGK